jgi:DNA-binding transcriptional MerR regulator
MSLLIEGKKYYRTSEACSKAGISRATLFRWLRNRIIKDVNHKDRRGWRLFTEADINRLKKEANKVNVNHKPTKPVDRG